MNGVDAAAAARAERKSAKTGIVLTQVSVHDDDLGEDGGGDDDDSCHEDDVDEEYDVDAVDECDEDGGNMLWQG